MGATLGLILDRSWRRRQGLRLALACASSWMEAAVTDPAGGKRLIVYDEGWRVMRDPRCFAECRSSGSSPARGESPTS